jgi:hypothetical protein
MTFEQILYAVLERQKQPNITNFDPKYPGRGCNIDICPVEYSLYGYLPSKPASLIFMVLFGLSFVGHVYQGLKKVAWTFMIALGLGCLMEVIGEFCRKLSHPRTATVGTLGCPTSPFPSRA